jgi:hypothetical protein
VPENEKRRPTARRAALVLEQQILEQHHVFATTDSCPQPPSEPAIRGAMKRTSSGEPSSPIGAALDRIEP